MSQATPSILQYGSSDFYIFFVLVYKTQMVDFLSVNANKIQAVEVIQKTELRFIKLYTNEMH